MGFLLQIFSVVAFVFGAIQSPDPSPIIQINSVVVHTVVHTHKQCEPLLQLESELENDEEDDFSSDKILAHHDEPLTYLALCIDEHRTIEPSVFNNGYLLISHSPRGPPVS